MSLGIMVTVKLWSLDSVSLSCIIHQYPHPKVVVRNILQFLASYIIIFIKHSVPFDILQVVAEINQMK